MPTYCYECPTHGEFEEFHSMSQIMKFCPKCKDEGKEQELKQLINCMSKGVVELTGQELTEKTKKDAEAFKRDVYSSEKLYSNVVGESR